MTKEETIDNDRRMLPISSSSVYNLNEYYQPYILFLTTKKRLNLVETGTITTKRTKGTISTLKEFIEIILRIQTPRGKRKGYHYTT